MLILVTTNIAVEDIDSLTVSADWHGARIFSPSNVTALIINVKIRHVLRYDSNVVLSGRVLP
jgi:hypothetical protein